MRARATIDLHRPVLAGNEWRYVKQCLDSGWVSTAGAFVGRFEDATAAFLGVSHAVAVTNGTGGLHLALRLLGVKAGDEVLVPGLTFIATANAAVYLGAVPRFLDVEEERFGLDPDALADFLGNRCRRRGGRTLSPEGRPVTACIAMHAFGHPARVDELAAVCARHGVALLEDAAEALGTRYRGRAAGAFAPLGVFSFNGNKIVTAGGGGMLVSADATLARRARHLSTQAKSDAVRFWHDDLGYNYRLPNLNAALGLAQLEQLPGFLARKRAIARRYRDGLEGARGLRLLWEPEGAESNFWLNTVTCDSPARAKRLFTRLNARGVLARPFWGPCHRQPPFRGGPRARLPVTEGLWARSFNLPSSADLPLRAVDAICEELRRP